jgi:hypothetical protein
VGETRRASNDGSDSLGTRLVINFPIFDGAFHRYRGYVSRSDSGFREKTGANNVKAGRSNWPHREGWEKLVCTFLAR